MDDEASGSAAGEQLDDPDELLFRQVHPGWVDEGVPSSQAFAPTKKDEGKLSVDRGSLTTAQKAYEHHTTVRNLSSAGTWAVTVGEARGADLGSFGEPVPDDVAHGFIDFRSLTRKVSERRAKLLLAHAVARGRIHP